MRKILLLLYCLLAGINASAQVTERGAPTEAVVDSVPLVKGEFYALVVGVSTYKYLKPLSYADADAELFADFLLSKAGGSIKKENLVVLKNDSAKSGDFWSKFSMIYSKIKKGDRFIIYFAGHGDAAAEGINEYYLLLQDCFPGTDPSSYLAGGHAIDIEKLKNRIEKMTVKGAEVLLILDACRTNELVSGHAADRFNRVAEVKMGEIMMYATGRGQVSIESSAIGNGHGLFTFYLIEGLSGAADKETGDKNGEVTLRELKYWIETKVPAIAQRFSKSQEPFICCDENNKTVIVKTDSAFFEQWQIAKTTSDFSGSLAINRFRSAQGTVLSDTGVIRIYNRFNTAVKNLNLWGGNTSAAALYDSMLLVYPNHAITEEAGYNLAAQFMNFAQEKIALYLAAKDEGIITQTVNPETQEAGNEIVNRQLKRQLKISNVNWGETAGMYEKAISILQKSDSSVVSSMTPNLYFLKARNLVFGSAADKKQALSYAYRAYNYNRNSAYILHTLGLSLSENNKYDSALIIEKRALELAPNWSYVLYAIGLNFYELKKNDSAIVYLREAIRINPKSELPYSGMGIVFEDMNKTDSSLLYYKEAIRINPKYEFQYNNLGVLFAKLNQFDSAVFYYKQALRLNPNYEFAISNMAIAFEKWKKFDSAIVYYRKANQFDPNNEKLFTNLARIYLNGLNKNDSAIYYYKEAIKINPANTVLPLKLSNAYYRQGNYFFVTRKKADSAVQYYKQAIELNPNSEMLRYLYCGRAYYSIPKYDSALIYFKEGLRRNPDSLTLCLYIGKTYKDMKQFDSAVHYFNMAINKDANYLDAYVEMGLFYKDRGNSDSSVYYYTKALQIKPDAKGVYNNLGFVYYKAQKWDSAIVYFRKAIEVNPTSENLYLNLGNAFFSSNRYDSSIAVYKIATGLFPKSEPAFLSLGDAYLMKERYDSAGYCFKAVIKINKFSNLAYYKLAGTYAMQKDKENALSNLELAFKNGFKDEKELTDDPLFDSLRTDADFIKLVKQYLGT